MGVGEAIVAIIKALPDIVKLVTKIGESIGGLVDAAKDAQLNNWLDSLNQATRDLKNAKTLRERIDAAKRLNDLSRGM